MRSEKVGAHRELTGAPLWVLVCALADSNDLSAGFIDHGDRSIVRARTSRTRASRSGNGSLKTGFLRHINRDHLFGLEPTDENLPVRLGMAELVYSARPDVAILGTQ